MCPLNSILKSYTETIPELFIDCVLYVKLGVTYPIKVRVRVRFRVLYVKLKVTYSHRY